MLSIESIVGCAALTGIWLVVTGRGGGPTAVVGGNRGILGEFMKRRR